uniref:Uncharacterized protein n=1 Tax=Anopheles maculatus TaxID=74869 RepID=A0A182SPA4_9DIPT
MKDIYRYLSRCLRAKIRAKRKIKEIAVQLYTVDKGFKQGFLWDVGCLSMDDVRHLLDTLKKVNLVSSSLVIVQLGQDSFADFGVCDMNRWYVGHEERPVIIDVSAGHSAPRTADASVATLHNGLVDLLQARLKATAERGQPFTQIVQWPLGEDVCRTSAYGLFIGYPVVYWYVTEITHENCLSMVPLAVFQAGMKPHGDEAFDPFVSFSVPTALLNQPAVKMALNLWEESVARNNFKCVTFTKVFNTVIM